MDEENDSELNQLIRRTYEMTKLIKKVEGYFKLKIVNDETVDKVSNES